MILALLMGWQFTAAEFVGGPIMIVLVAVLFRLFVRSRTIEAARAQAERGIAGSMEGHAAMEWRCLQCHRSSEREQIRVTILEHVRDGASGAQQTHEILRQTSASRTAAIDRPAPVGAGDGTRHGCDFGRRIHGQTRADHRRNMTGLACSYWRRPSRRSRFLRRRIESLICGRYRNVVQFCSGLVDLVLCVRRDGDGCHGFAFVGDTPPPPLQAQRGAPLQAHGGTAQMLALPAFHCSHGMFQSPSPSVPGSVDPNVLTTSTMSPRLVLSWNQTALLGLTLRQPWLVFV